MQGSQWVIPSGDERVPMPIAAAFLLFVFLFSFGVGVTAGYWLGSMLG